MKLTKRQREVLEKMGRGMTICGFHIQRLSPNLSYALYRESGSFVIGVQEADVYTFAKADFIKEVGKTGVCEVEYQITPKGKEALNDQPK